MNTGTDFISWLMETSLSAVCVTGVSPQVSPVCSCCRTPLQGVFVSVSKMQLEHKKWWCQRARLSVHAALRKERGSQAFLWPVASVWRWGNVRDSEVLGFHVRKRQLTCFNLPVLVWTVFQCFSRIDMWHYEAEATSDSRVEVKPVSGMRIATYGYVRALGAGCGEPYATHWWRQWRWRQLSHSDLKLQLF